jgi:TonB family protein
VPHYFVSTFADYAAIGRAYASAAAPATAVTPAIQALADNITKGTHGRRDEARALYAWVAGHIRYVAVELGKGTLVPHPADTVLSNGYGDCKDHVALLEALLKARGIASEAVLLNATIIYELSEAPTFAGLDHVITFIPSLNVYLDSTAAVAPFGVLPFSEYGKPAIYASETAPRMGVMPVLPAGLASVTTKTVTHLDKDGVLSGTTVTTAAGPYSIALRAEGLGIQALGSEASAKRLLSATGQGSDASGTLDAPPPTEMSDSYTVSGSFTEKGWSSQLAGTQEFYLPGGMRLLGLSGDGPMGPLGSATLKPDVTLPCYSAEATEDLSLEAPAGAQFSNVPADTHVKSANVRFDAHWTLANSTIGVHRHFVSAIDRPLCTAAIRAANSQALKAILDSYNVSLSFEPPGKPPQDAWYASDIANPPKDPKLAAMLEDGLAAMHRHDDVAAIAKFSAILAEHDLPISASFPARFDRAALYARNWRYEDALADLNAALVLTPGDTRMLASRAFVYFSQADFSRSLADCQTVLGQDPADAFALQLRANTEMETGKYADAVRDYTSVLRISATPNALVLRAVAYHQLGRESDSAGDIAQAEAKGDDSAKGDYAEIVGATRAGDVARKSTNAVVIQDAHPASGADVPALNSHTAEWPPLSGRLQETGRVRVDFTIEPDGHVDEPRIEKSCGFPRLDTASLEAVKTWRYRPSLHDGKPVATHFSAEVDWTGR